VTPFDRAFDAVEASEPVRRMVLDALTSPERHWHGLLHHALMLRHIARTAPTGTSRNRLIWATLFHDIVYDATRNDNEERSAELAGQWVPATFAKRVAELILATKRHDLATDQETRTLLEADLGVLWTPHPPLYAFYATGIRAEYAHVSEEAYRAGRTAVMTRLHDDLMPYLDATRGALLRRNVEGELTTLAT
jgi:predicted metal-dependent HD superfamily phosphohydrolase